MPNITLDIVTAERMVFSDVVDAVIAPGVEGQLGILPHHAPLMTMLEPGEIVVRKGSEEFFLAVSGGFLEVRPDRVIILADTAERAEEINVARAEEAKRHATDLLSQHVSEVDMATVEAAMRRSIARLSVARKRRKKPSI